MTRHDQRMVGLVQAMSPEDKAHWVIEAPIMGEEIADAEVDTMLRRMKPEEGRRYDAILCRWAALRRNMIYLSVMVTEVKVKLLERGRILWYLRALQDLAEGLVFGDGAEALLVKNRNLTPGKPITPQLAFADVRLGVWGRRRYPFSDAPLVQPHERTELVLDVYAQGIRLKAGECKALAAYLLEEAKAMRLATVERAIAWTVSTVSGHDRRPGAEVEDGEATELPGSIFPVDERWALVWEEVAEDQDTARRVREDPEKWHSPSDDGKLAGPPAWEATDYWPHDDDVN